MLMQLPKVLEQSKFEDSTVHLTLFIEALISATGVPRILCTFCDAMN